MTKPKLAGHRNWNKMRLLGCRDLFSVDKTGWSITEKKELEAITFRINSLLEYWDLGTEELELKPTYKKHCSVCFMRRRIKEGTICRECNKAPK